MMSFQLSQDAAITKRLSSIFSISCADLKAIYKCWNSRVNSESVNRGDDFEYYPKNIYCPCDPCLRTQYHRSQLVGIDLPVIVSTNDRQKCCTMIVGEDPLRNRDDFGDYLGQAVIGTPYAFHSRYYRDRRTALYSLTVEHVLSKKHNVYLTDICKVWAEGQNDQKGRRRRKVQFTAQRIQDKQVFFGLLKCEFEIVKPTHCISFGKKAERSIIRLLKELDFKPTHLPLPHPSGANNATWAIILNGDVNDEMKLAHIKCEIDKLYSRKPCNSNRT